MNICLLRPWQVQVSLTKKLFYSFVNTIVKKANIVGFGNHFFSLFYSSSCFAVNKPQVCNFIEKETLAQCFPVNFTKFLRTLFLKNTSGGCFCQWWLFSLLNRWILCMESFVLKILVSLPIGTKFSIFWLVIF